MAYSTESYFSESFTHDSDAVQEMFCEHCMKHDNKYAIAEGFCEECLEYMCGTCLKFHKRYMDSHTIKDKNGMPQDFCLEKCSDHKGELIKFYCHDCKKFACTKCKIQDHRNCKMINHLPSLVPGIEKSSEIKELTEGIEELVRNLKTTEMHVNKNLKTITSQEAKILCKIKEKKREILAVFENHQKETIEDFEKKIKDTLQKLKEEKKGKIENLEEKRKKLEKLLDKEEAELRKIIDTIKQDDQQRLQTIMRKTYTMKNDVTAVSTEMTRHKNTDERCQLFIAMKKAHTIIEQVRPRANEHLTNNTIHFYNVECKAYKHNIANIQNSDNMFTFQEIHESEVETAKFCSDIEYRCGLLSYFCLLSDNCLLIIKNDSISLDIFKDLSVNSVTCDSIDMSSVPWAIAKLDNYKVAVTLPDIGVIRLITFSKSMTVTNIEDIRVGKGCHGVTYGNNQLIVSYDTTPAAVKILDISGKVLKTFSKDHNRRPLFKTPLYLTLSPDNTVIYVSDLGEHSVLGLTFDGKVKSIYKNTQLNSPTQVTVDRSGTVFVGGFLSKNVHQLSPDLTKVKILLDRRHGISFPVAVIYCQDKNRLYVGQQLGYIKVFDVSLS